MSLKIHFLQNLKAFLIVHGLYWIVLSSPCLSLPDDILHGGLLGHEDALVGQLLHQHVVVHPHLDRPQLSSTAEKLLFLSCH